MRTLDLPGARTRAPSLRAQRGVTTAEYVVLAAVLVLGLVAGVSVFKGHVGRSLDAEGGAVEEVASGSIAAVRDRYGESGGPGPSGGAPPALGRAQGAALAAPAAAEPERAVLDTPRAAPESAPAPASRAPAVASVGGGEPSVDLNGTRYTRLEGSAADDNISIRLLREHRNFDPLASPGVALTNGQARALGVRVGDEVVVHDNTTGRDVVARYYDNAGNQPDGDRHVEMSPALADQLGVNYRNRRGRVVDAVANSEQMVGRFDVRRR